MIFATAALAFEWAETILSIREGGRSNAAMLEMVGNGGVSKDYAVLDAIEIRAAARIACFRGLPCPHPREQCLFHWHLPDPLVEYPQLSDSQEQRIRDCSIVFEDMLIEMGFMAKRDYKRR